MIKRFLEYIKESITLNDFKYSDNFQSIFDAWENYMNIGNHNDHIQFVLTLPDSLEKLIEFNKDITQFTSDLKVILDSLEIDGLKYLLQTKGNDSRFTIEISIFSKFSFDLINKILTNNNYRSYYYSNILDTQIVINSKD